MLCLRTGTNVFHLVKKRLWYIKVRFDREGTRAYKEGFDDGS